MGLSVTLYIPLDAGQDIDPDEPYWENEYHEFYSGNTTHNLTKMADKADLYECLWRPYRLLGIEEDDEYTAKIYAENISSKIKEGLDKLLSEPEYYKQFDSPNGWGLYIHFIKFVQNYYDACIKYPRALVNASR